MPDAQRIALDEIEQRQAVIMLERIERRLERLEKLLNEFAGAFLSASFPYGDGKTDRWGRRR